MYPFCWQNETCTQPGSQNWTLHLSGWRPFHPPAKKDALGENRLLRLYCQAKTNLSEGLPLHLVPESTQKEGKELELGSSLTSSADEVDA